MTNTCEEVEYHYAGVNGCISRVVDGVFEKVDGWPAHHELFAEFQRLRESGEIHRLRTQTWGHPHFHGHTGSVDIYGISE